MAHRRGRLSWLLTILIDKLLATVIQLKASDLHITVGQPPVIRHHGRMRRLDTKVLEQDDTTALMKSITPDRCQQELQEVGGSDFAIEFTDGYRFRVAIFKQRGNIGMVLRRIPSQFLTLRADRHARRHQAAHHPAARSAARHRPDRLRQDDQPGAA